MYPSNNDCFNDNDNCEHYLSHSSDNKDKCRIFPNSNYMVNICLDSLDSPVNAKSSSNESLNVENTVFNDSDYSSICSIYSVNCKSLSLTVGVVITLLTST